jgi:hypothetical protein
MGSDEGSSHWQFTEEPMAQVEEVHALVDNLAAT